MVHSSRFVDSGAPANDYSMLAFTANLKGYLPLGRIQPFALVGAGLSTIWVDTQFGNKSYLGGAFRLGGGVDAYFTETWGIELQTSYVITTGNARDADYLSANLSVIYRF